MGAPSILIPAPSGGGSPVGGSGTAGTIPVWSTGTTLGDSPLTVSGSNVTGAGAIRATGTSAGAPAFTGSDTDTGMYFPANNQVRFSTAGSLAMAIDAAQNVSIGTASPAAKLHIVTPDGSPYPFAIAGTTKGLRIQTTAAQVQIDGVDSTLVGSYQPLFLNGSTVTLATGGSARLTADASGNVGIGTASPAWKFNIASGSFNFFIDPFGSSIWNIGTSASAAVAFYTGNTERARIDSNGRMLVGTSGTPLSSEIKMVVAGAGNGGQQWVGASGGGFAITPINGGGAYWYSFTGLTGAESYVQSFKATSTGIEITGTNYGLKLPATPGNADAQTLDAYSEGTWVPTLTGFGGTTPTVNAARYVRIGSVVHCTVVLTASPNFSSTYGTTTITAPFSATYNAAVPTNVGAAGISSGQQNAGGTTVFLPTFGTVTAGTISWTFLV